jgi:hypothetical protein
MQIASFALYVLIAAAIKNAVAFSAQQNDLGKIFGKRQNATTCNESVEDECQTNPSDCVAAMCKACSGWVQIAECCALSTVTAMAQCLLEALNNPSVLTTELSSTEAITGPSSTAAISAVDGLQACINFESVVLSCESETPGFASAPFTEKASCLCYSSGTYQGSFYDGAFSTCLAYVSTADPAEYANFTAGFTGSIDVAPCSHSGDMSQSQRGSTASTTYIGHTSTEASVPVSTAPTPSPSQAVGGTMIPTVTSGSTSLEMVSDNLGVSWNGLMFRTEPQVLIGLGLGAVDDGGALREGEDTMGQAAGKWITGYTWRHGGPSSLLVKDRRISGHSYKKRGLGGV